MKRNGDRRPGKGIARATPQLRGGYGAWLSDLKRRIRSAQIRASLSVNRELILLYWDIGRAIVIKQEQNRWGSAVIEQLAKDLHREFPEMSGFSASNIWRMRAFYRAYVDDAAILAEVVRESAPAKGGAKTSRARPTAKSKGPSILAQPVRELATEPPEPMASLPWGHNITLIETLSDAETRLFYARKAVENGWSRNMLAHWIASGLHSRQGKAITNFKTTLPPEKSDLAHQIIKDPYNFDFLTLREDASEKDLESGLLEHITRFLLELGDGFAFVGRQVRFEVDGEDFSIDLLFYHLRLRAYLVIDLKTGKFEPGFVGKINFHLSAVDDQLRTEADAPTIGLLLCRERSRIVVEYALRHLQRPIGVSSYRTTLTDKLPHPFAGSLPSVKDIKHELSRLTSPSRDERSRPQPRR